MQGSTGQIFTCWCHALDDRQIELFVGEERGVYILETHETLAAAMKRAEHIAAELLGYGWVPLDRAPEM